MGVFDRLLGKGVSKIRAPTPVAVQVAERAPRPIPARIRTPREAGPTLVPHPDDVVRIGGGPTLVPHPGDVPRFGGGPALVPHPMDLLRIGREAPKPGKPGSMWDAVRGLKGGRLDRITGMAVGAATSKYTMAGLATGGIAGLTGYGAYAGMTHQVDMHTQVSKQFNKMRNSLKYGGSNRRQDFEHNPMLTFSRPRVRGGHLGASGGLVLGLNNTRTRR